MLRAFGRVLAGLSVICGCSSRAVTTPPPGPAVGVAAAPSAAPAPPDVVDYRLSPVMEGDGLVALAVEMRLLADPSGVTRLHLPQEWASERELWRYVRDLRIEGGTTVAEDGAAVRVIDAAPGTELVVHYRVVSAYDHEPSASDGQPFAPIVRPAWFYAFGEALFAAPEGRDGTPAQFSWTDAPSDISLVSDLQHLEAYGGTVADVRDSIVMGGADVRLYTERDGEAPIRVAMLGEYTFSDDAFVRVAQEILDGERDFWGEHGEPFTIVLAPLVAVEGSRSLGGTGRGDAFTIIMSQDAPIEPLRHLIAHEYFHTWNSERLGGQQDGPSEMAGKWFSEGFTEFYTWRLLLRSGLYRVEDWVADWNAALAEYAASPVRNEPNSRVIADYWNVPAVGRLPYRRGPLLAAIWDQRLRAATSGARGLDDVLHAMRRAVQDAGDERPAADAASLFVETFVAVGGPDLGPDLERFIDRGETIALPEDVFGGCIRVVTETRPVFDRGWDAEATNAADNVVTGLRRGSPAYRAGLRDGMRLLARLGGAPGDSTVPYVVRVADGTREREITFRPRGEGRLTVQRLEIVGAKTVAEREACARTIAGGEPP